MGAGVLSESGFIGLEDFQDSPGERLWAGAYRYSACLDCQARRQTLVVRNKILKIP